MRQRVQGGAGTYADHVAAVARATGQPMPKPPEMPEAAQMVWRAFDDLDAQRGGNGFGDNPITYRDMLAWQQMTGWALDPWEVEAVRAVDDAYLAHRAKESARQ